MSQHSSKEQIYPLRAYCEQLPDARRRMVLAQEHCTPITVIAQPGEQVGVLTEGIGANFPPSYQKNQDRAFPENEQDWQRLFAHVDWLGIKILRYWVWGDSVMSRAGAFDRDHLYIQRLRRLDKWATARGVRLILDFSIIPSWLRYPAPADQPSVVPLHTGPRDVRAYADQFAMPILTHVIQELNLESVKYLCLFNEPFNVDLAMDTFYTPPDVDPFQRYVELHAELRRQLNDAGISTQRLGMIGPNSHDLFTEPLTEIHKRGLDLVSNLAFIDEHTYRMRFDYLPEAHHVPTLPMTELVEDRLRRAVRVANELKKPYILTEYSCFYYASPDGPRRHESTITEAEFVVRALAEGAGGALRYSLINSGEADGFWQLVNTTDGSYAPSPNYHAYAILSRYAPRGATIRRIDLSAPYDRTKYVHGVLLEYAPREFTALFVNDHPGEIISLDCAISATATSTPPRAWQTDAIYKHREIVLDRSAPPHLRLALPPMSVTAITSLGLDDSQPGWVDAR